MWSTSSVRMRLSGVAARMRLVYSWSIACARGPAGAVFRPAAWRAWMPTAHATLTPRIRAATTAVRGSLLNIGSSRPRYRTNALKSSLNVPAVWSRNCVR